MSEDTEQPGTGPTSALPAPPVDPSAPPPEGADRTVPAGEPYPPPSTTASAPPPPVGPDTAPTPVIPFFYPPSNPTTDARGTPGRFRSWLPLAIVAALIGGGIGAGVTA